MQVRSYVGVPLTSNQFSALVSWTFNGGEGLLARSRMLANLNRWDYAGAAAELVKDFEPRLLERKRAEQALFNGQYGWRAEPACLASRTGVCNQPRC